MNLKQVMMKKTSILIILILFFYSNLSCSQEIIELELQSINNCSPVTLGVETGIYHYSEREFQYPENAILYKIEGKVLIEFVIDTSGRTHSHKIINGLGHGIDKELLRIYKSLPECTPMNENGKKKDVTVRIPYFAKLNKHEIEKSNAAKRKFSKAKKLARKEKYNQSNEILNKLLDQFSLYKEAYYLRAKNYLALKETENACHDLGQAYMLGNIEANALLHQHCK